MVFEQGMRLDKWLWFSRLSHSRTDAQKLCEGRHLRIDGRVIDKSGAIVRAGNVISYPWGRHVIAVRVRHLAERRLSPPKARELYEALLPAPTPQLSEHPGFADFQKKPEVHKEGANI